MSVVDGLLHRLRVLFRGETYAREQEREVRFHLELESLAQTQAGRAQRDAEIKARHAFGNVSYWREEMRQMTSLAALDRLRQNLSYAARGLRRTPGFSLAVIATIALGAGLNATMFSLLDRVLVRPPAGVSAPLQLRRLYLDPGYAVTQRGSHVFPFFSYPNFRALRDAVTGTELIAYTHADSLGLGDGGAVTAHVSYVSPNYFSSLGVRAVTGRVFGSDEAAIDAPTPVMVVSERLWRSGFGADPAILGRVMTLGRMRVTIVGIVPAAFAGLDISGTDAWLPLNTYGGGVLSGPPWYTGGGNYLTVIARPHDAASEADLKARGALAIRAVESELRGKPDRTLVLTGSIIEARGPGEEATELTLSTRIAGVAAIVLLIACANVATLLLVRATRRRQEIAVRRALGASQLRLYEQLLVESLLLALLGGAAALVLATWGGAALRTLLFPRIHWVEGTIDVRVATFIAAIVAVVGLVAGLVPASTAARSDVMNALRAGATEGAYRRSLVASVLLAFQAALCVVLVVGAGLFIRSFANVRSIDVGFDPNGIVFAGLSSSPDKRWGADATPLLAQSAAALRSMPGVKGTALASPPPMGGYAVTRLYRPNGDSLFRIGNDFPAYTTVTPDYFATVGIRS